MDYRSLEKLLDDVFLSDKAREKIIEKDKSDEYRSWKELTKNNKTFDKQLLNDTTGQNFGFTYFQILTEKNRDTNFSDHFTVQKSFLGDFVTFYVKSQMYRQSGVDKIIYNPTLICEPVGKFKPFFEASWKLLKKNYPNLIYVPFFILEKFLKSLWNIKLKKDVMYMNYCLGMRATY